MPEQALENGAGVGGRILALRGTGPASEPGSEHGQEQGLEPESETELRPEQRQGGRTRSQKALQG